MDKKNNSFEEIWKKLSEFRGKKVLMSLHAGPDGDSLGACCGMKYVLERDFECDVKLISGDGLAESLSRLDFSKEVEFGKDITDVDFAEFDLLIMLDTSTEQMIGSWKKDFNVPREIFKINIDHHDTNNYFGDMNYIDEKQPSACSVLVDFFRQCEVKFDKELSRRLLLGICTDTLFFKNSCTGEMKSVFEDVVFLMGQGVDYLKEIVDVVVHNKPLRIKQYHSLLVNNLKFDKERKIAWSVLSKEEIKPLKLEKSEVRGGIKHIGDIEGFELIFNLVETEDYIKGSFRSNTGIDTVRIAKAVGGGGHKFASAVMFEDISLEEAEKKVLDAIDKIGLQKG